MRTRLISYGPEETFKAGEEFGRQLKEGDLVLLTGGLGAGKTLFTKGILRTLDFDTREVTSPSFTLVNLYQAGRADVYHIDLWRLEESSNPAEAVGLDEILENPQALTIIEWADRLGEFRAPNRTFRITIEGDGEGPREIQMIE